MSFKTCCVQNCMVKFEQGSWAASSINPPLPSKLKQDSDNKTIKAGIGGIPFHCFPNPDTEQDRFQVWVRSIGNEVAKLEPHYVFKNRRICHRHFNPIYYGPSNRLSKIAVPTLDLPEGPSFSIQEEETSIIPGRSSSCVFYSCAVASTSKDNTTILHRKSEGPSFNIQEEETSILPGRSSSCVFYSDAVASTSKDNTTILPRKSGIKSSLTENEMKLKKVIVNLKKELFRNKEAKKSFKNRLMLAKKTMKQDAIKNISAHMTKAAKSFLRLQIREAGKKSKGRRFTTKEKILALSLYKPSPKAYRLLSEICILPNRKTLSKLLQKIPLKSGINDFLFEDLKAKTNKLPEHHKYCTLIFDEMAISPHLTYDQKNDEIIGFVDTGEKRTNEFSDKVLVFMIRGVIKKFKQPVAYYFGTSNLKAWDLVSHIRKVVEKVQDAGFKIIATVCDQGTANMSAINILIKKTKEDYIKNNKTWKGGFFEINLQKIVPIYDPPHLIKGIRNNLLNKNLKYTLKGKECTAKWQHIIDLYKRSPGYGGVRLVPKLTAHHVFPHLIPKMRVKHCTQVFSSSVGVALGFMADAGKLPSDSKETADLLLLFDKIFDSVNGSSSKIEKGKMYRTAVTPTSPHHKLWQETIPIIKSMKFVDASGKCSVVPSLMSWVKTLESIRVILKDFCKIGIKSVLLRNFNQDPIENFFGAIRAHGSQNIMPDAAAFQAAFKTLLINNLSSSHSIGANCEKDKSYCLLKSLTHIINQSECSHTLIDEDIIIYEEHLTIQPVNIDNILKSKNIVDIERCAALAYCSGWLLLKLKKINKNCAVCKQNVESDTIEEYHNYIKVREYSDKGWLCYPKKETLNFFLQTEHITYQIMRTHSSKINLLQYIKFILSINLDMSFVSCHLHKEQNIKLLFHKCVTFHIFTWCKNINKILAGKEINIDINDEMQMAAFQYREKNKTKKRVRAAGREVSL